MIQPVRVLVLGASGRLGAMLRQYWPDELRTMWQFRCPVDRRGVGHHAMDHHAVDHRDTVIFDPLGKGVELPRCDVVVGLAGIVSGPDAALRGNTDLALAAVDLGAKLGARRVFLSSSAAVYGYQPSPLAEDGPTRPQSPYGTEKLRMEAAALAQSKALGVPVTVLRIGNVAGADALLGQAGLGQDGLGQAKTEQAGTGPIMLDQFADGQGPRRSYIGPKAFADVMAKLAGLAATGRDLPNHINLALPGSVAMADMLRAAAIPFEWRTAPAQALPEVALDVGRLAALMPVPLASPAGIVQDWLTYKKGAL